MFKKPGGNPNPQDTDTYNPHRALKLRLLRNPLAAPQSYAMFFTPLVMPLSVRKIEYHNNSQQDSGATSEPSHVPDLSHKY